MKFIESLNVLRDSFATLPKPLQGVLTVLLLQIE